MSEEGLRALMRKATPGEWFVGDSNSWRRFCTHFHRDGRCWNGPIIWACTWEQAEAKAALWGLTVDGEFVAEMPDGGAATHIQEVMRGE